MAPRAGVVSSGIGYGAVINGVSSQAKAANIDQMTDEIVRNLQSGGGDLQPIGKTTPIKVAGVRGRSVNMQSNRSHEEAERHNGPLVTENFASSYSIFSEAEPSLDYESRCQSKKKTRTRVTR